MAKLILLFLIIVLLFLSAEGASKASPSSDFIKSSCGSTRYPFLCYHCLARYASLVHHNELSLARVALTVTLERARSTQSLVSSMGKMKGLKKLDAQAVKDCIETVGDSVDRLRQSIGELKRAGPSVGSDFLFHVSNVQTWVSAALTDEDTCLDGFDGTDGRVRAMLRRRIVNVARVTSVGLALVNRFAAMHP